VPSESDPARKARLRQRRRLVVWSVPVVVMLLLVAGKLFATVAWGEDARQAYAGGNITATEEAARRLGFLNVLEPHKAPFALGDARVMAEDYEGARAAFEEALTRAPGGTEESCQIRVNLVLTLERLASAATAAGRTAAAAAYVARLDDVVAQAPPACFEGDAQDEEGQQLRDAQQRADEQQQQEQQRQAQQGPTPPDPGQTAPGPEKQQQLDDKTQDNLQQRQQSDQKNPQGSSGSGVDKPW
jgi:hypothetical protein